MKIQKAISIATSIPFMLIFMVLTSAMSSCEDDKKSIEAAFEFDFLDENNVIFTNISKGDYYSLKWDFGNGEILETTDKSKKPEIYFPSAGIYKVTLSVFDYMGDKVSFSKEIEILESDLILDFTLVTENNEPNFVKLSNQTQGSYDSFKWFYRNVSLVNIPNPKIYFPYKGTYVVKLEVYREDDTFRIEKNIAIPTDDPNIHNNMELVWSDEFDDVNLNTTNWTFEYGASGWGNNELQNYTNGENTEINDGKLVIVAKKVNDDKAVGSYTSARIISKGKREFTYGKMEIRAKLPSGTGIWPAIWMLGSNISSVGWPACGEIDIMEYVGFNPNTVHTSLHTPSSFGGTVNTKSHLLQTCEEEFHNYGMIWTKNDIRFYIDSIDNIVYTYAPSNKNSDTWPFDQPHFFILNVAVGGTWGGSQGIENSIFPQKMEIDYVRVYQPKDYVK